MLSYKWWHVSFWVLIFFSFMKKIIFSICLFLFQVALATAQEHRTIIISLDGCRWDYPEMYDTPFLDHLAEVGVKAVMQPSFPSVTFPNHYTLATGLVPDHHGIIANSFLDVKSGLVFSLGNKKTKQDPRFWGGEPIWITAKHQGKRVGVVYWPGSDVAIQGVYPDIYYDYEKKPLLTYVERIAEIERMLKMPEDKRPQLIMAYFDEPDHSGHTFGPESKQTRMQVETLDCLLGQLWNDIQHMPDGKNVNLIITADHGMARNSNERIINLANYLDKSLYKDIVNGFPTMIYPNKGCAGKILKALSKVPHIRAWRKGEMPAYLNYGTNKNIAEIVVSSDIGWVISDKDKVLAGNHGFDPTYGDMHVVFRAAGPDFKQGYVKTQTFKNVDVYPLLNHLIGTTPSKNDGNLSDISDLLR